MTTVRTITDEEVEAYTKAMATGFHHRVQDGEVEARRSLLLLDRTLGAFDGATMVGTARAFPTTLTVPGGNMVTAAAVTNVAVVPTHRRRGLLSSMMTTQLDDVADRGEPLAILIASEGPIYGRFGYGAATQHASLKIDTARARFAGESPGGPVRQVERSELRQLAPQVFDRFRRVQPGAIDRAEIRWDILLGDTPWPGDTDSKDRVHVVAGEDGYVLYRTEEKWDGRVPASTLTVDELVAATPEAYELLWRYCIGLDWVAVVEAHDRPPVEPLPWLLTDFRRARVAEIADFLWVRVMDVPAALAARSYSGDGRIVLEVVDRFRPGGAAAGRFRLDATVDGATCEPTDERADLTLTVEDLGAAYLGGAPLYLPAAAGRVDEHTPGALRRFDALFTAHPIPWCNTWF